MNYSLYLLDADGTLFDYNRAEHAALKGACGRFGIRYEPQTERLYAEVNGRCWALYEQGRLTAARLQTVRFEKLFAALGAGAPDPAAFNEVYMSLLAEGSYLLPGALAVCRALRAHGKRLALVTNGLLRTQKKRFERSPLWPLFDAAVVSEQAGFAKPDPRYFEYALRLLRHPQRRDVLVVGDSLTADIAGGTAAGLDTCWFNPAGKPAPDGVRPTYRIRALPQLLTVESEPAEQTGAAGAAGDAALEAAPAKTPARPARESGPSDGPARCAAGQDCPPRPAPLEFRWCRGTGDTDSDGAAASVFGAARRVREAVFIREQRFQSEFDDTDRAAFHVVGWLGARPAAAARLFEESGGVWHAGRVCVLKEFRGRGYGAALMRQVIRRARALGASTLRLGAQLYAVPFYQKAGFTVSGGLYLDEGVPHRRMELRLGAAAPAERETKMVRINENFLKVKKNYLFADIAQRVAKFRAAHPDKKVISLGIGDVTRPLPAACIRAMRRAVDEMGDERTFRGYGPEQGYDFLREAIAEHDFKARGVDISPDEIFVSDGAKSDTGNIGDIFSAADTVVVCDPVYPVYLDTSVMAGRSVRFVPCGENSRFTPEPPDYPADLVYLCSPNNPTGAALSRNVLGAWVDYARRNGAVILFDAAYERFITEPDIPHSIFEIDGARECAIEFRSFSKTAGFTGVRCGYAIVPKDVTAAGPDGERIALRPLWLRRQCTKFNGTCYIVQRGAEAVFTPEGQKQVDETIGYYRENARIILDGLTAAGFRCAGGKNAPYIWMKCPDGLTSWQFFDKLLERAAVVGTPGAGFGASGEGFFRLTAFGSRDDTREAVGRIRAARF